MNIAVIAGDGIGRDVTAEAVKVLGALGEVGGRRPTLEHLPWSADHYLRTGETLPANGYDLLRRLRPRVAALIDSDGLVRTTHELWRRW